MRYFQKLAEGIDVFSLLHAITKQSDLWNANNFRTTYENTPFKDGDDILIRYSSKEIVKDRQKVINDVNPVWYDSFYKLPQIVPIINNLMRAVNGYELQRVLISRLPPGGKILAHADNSGAYVDWNDIGRYHVVLQGLPGSLFNCGSEQVQMLTSSIWWFDHTEIHSVVNNSVDDRIHLMIDIRTMN